MIAGVTVTDWYLWVGAALMLLGVAFALLLGDRIRRLIALNVCSGGTLVILLTVAVAGDGPDPVPQALALTSIVITIAMTGLGIVLSRRLDEREDES